VGEGRACERLLAQFATLFFLFFTWFVTWMYLPALMGIEVFGGSPNPSLPAESPLKRKYNAGVLASSEGMLWSSCVTLGLAFVLPRLTVAIGEMRVFVVLEALHVVLIVAIAGVSDPHAAVWYIALLGAPFSAFLVIPYALVGRAAKATHGSAGKVMATMNLFMCLPELVVSIGLGPIVAAADGSMRVPMRVAALSCAVAVAIIAFAFPTGWRGGGCAAACRDATPAPNEPPAQAWTATVPPALPLSQGTGQAVVPCRGLAECTSDAEASPALITQLSSSLQAAHAKLEEQCRMLEAQEERLSRLEAAVLH
jgi:hypothetical protein